MKNYPTRVSLTMKFPSLGITLVNVDDFDETALGFSTQDEYQDFVNNHKQFYHFTDSKIDSHDCIFGMTLDGQYLLIKDSNGILSVKKESDVDLEPFTQPPVEQQEQPDAPFWQSGLIPTITAVATVGLAYLAGFYYGRNYASQS